MNIWMCQWRCGKLTCLCTCAPVRSTRTAARAPAVLILKVANLYAHLFIPYWCLPYPFWESSSYELFPLAKLSIASQTTDGNSIDLEKGVGTYGIVFHTWPTRKQTRSTAACWKSKGRNVYTFSYTTSIATRAASWGCIACENPYGSETLCCRETLFLPLTRSHHRPLVL